MLQHAAQLYKELSTSQELLAAQQHEHEQDFSALQIQLKSVKAELSRSEVSEINNQVSATHHM